MILNVAALWISGKYLEAFWGTKEFVKFILLISALSGLGSFITNTILFLFRNLESSWFPIIPFGGFGGIISAFSVAGKQLIPDHEVIFLLFIPIKIKHVPIILLIINTFYHIIGFPSTTLSFIFFATFSSWVYLRFWQKKEESIGDSSESFSFSSFFPEPIQTPINLVSKIFSKIFCLNSNKLLPTSINTNINITSVLQEPEDAERRRLKALKEVDAKLLQMKFSSASTSNEQNV